MCASKKNLVVLRVFETKNRVLLRSDSGSALDILNHTDLRESSPAIYFLKIHNRCGVISDLDASGLCLFFQLFNRFYIKYTVSRCEDYV